jgi:hypothetical protein
VSDVTPLAEVARRFRISFHRTHKVLLTRQPEPGERRARHWYVSAEAVALLKPPAVYPASR